jgi:UDP-N-acetylmuramate dehydrogenase
VLGGGSNALVADAGVDALVLCPAIRGVRALDEASVEVGAGEPWDPFVERAGLERLAGVECLSGIPGLVGATPIQNVGAYGQDVSETIARVHAVDRRTGEVTVLDAGACEFAYRDSVFKRALRDRVVVTRVVFSLRPGGAPAVRYAELERALAREGLTAPTLADARRVVVGLRRAKSMVLDPADENRRSAGSFFTNPILDDDALAAALARIGAASVLGPGESIPRFAADDGRGTKLAAAWLIERAGFAKGTTDGRVGLSTKHTLAIVNKGGATAAEILAFARRVQLGVRARFGVTLRPEPVLLGFSADAARELLD